MRKQGGFTLVETLVAMGVFAVGVVATTSMLIESTRGGSINEYRIRSAMLLERILEEVEAMAADAANFQANGAFIMPEGQIDTWRGVAEAELPNGALYVTPDNYLMAGELTNRLAVDVGWGAEDNDLPADTSRREQRIFASKQFTGQ